MSKVTITKGLLDDLADTISDKSGESTPMTIIEMTDAVDNMAVPSGTIEITSNGIVNVADYASADVDVEPNLQNKSVNYTPSETAQSGTVQADSGYDGLDTVSVSVGAVSSSYVGSGVDRRTSSDLTASGATVTAPAGYYESSASKAVASGTAGTPTATKGAISNNSVTVTPSVTNTTGYITGGTKTGTGVSVSASELVSGTLEITENGEGIDVTNYASVDVDVAGGSRTTWRTIYDGTITVTSSSGYRVWDASLFTSEPEAGVDWRTPFLSKDTSKVRVTWNNTVYNCDVFGQYINVGNPDLPSTPPDDVQTEPPFIFYEVFPSSTAGTYDDHYLSGLTNATVGSQISLKVEIADTVVSSEWTTLYDGTATMETDNQAINPVAIPSASGTNVMLVGYTYRITWGNAVYVYTAAKNDNDYIYIGDEDDSVGLFYFNEYINNNVTYWYAVLNTNLFNMPEDYTFPLKIEMGSYNPTVSAFQAYMGIVSTTANYIMATSVRLTVEKTGIYTVSWMAVKASTNSTSTGTGYTALYINGTQYGSLYSLTYTGSTNNTIGRCIVMSSVSLTAGDELIVYAQAAYASSTTYPTWVGNLIIQEE